METIVEPEDVADNIERIKMNEYLNRHKKLQHKGIINYHHMMLNKKNSNVKHDEWLKLSKPLFNDDDYREIKDTYKVMSELQSDLEIFENYSNFNF
jgi:hypothetical protein